MMVRHIVDGAVFTFTVADTVSVDYGSAHQSITLHTPTLPKQREVWSVRLCNV